jgi:hypothetical protein
MPIRTTTPLARRAGYLAAALALLFGLGHFAWAAGIPVLGATRADLDTIGEDGAAHVLTETAVGFLESSAPSWPWPWCSRGARPSPGGFLRLVAWAGTPWRSWPAATA